jgi:lysyl-tRNA synthetase class 2
MRRRADLLQRVRGFFVHQGHLEVDTPLAAPRLIPEPSIEVFPVGWVERDGAAGPPLYLLPSPELWMRRLLAAGSGSIFQICHCFRNVEERGPLHQPEFTMLEWYTTGASYRDAATLTAKLLASLGHAEAPRWFSVRELFATHAGLDLDALQDLPSMRQAARRAGVPVGEGSDWEECFNKILLTHVEPAIAAMGTVFVLDYPYQIRTLARRKAHTPYAERWELYIRGVELANCYGEETDLAVVRSYLEEESTRKEAARVPHPTEREIADLAIPACSGVALGLDRLFMVLMGLHALDQVIYFPGFGIL